MAATLSLSQIAGLMTAEQGEVAARYLMAGDKIYARRSEWTWSGQVVTVVMPAFQAEVDGRTVTRVCVKDAAEQIGFFDVLGKECPIRMAG